MPNAKGSSKSELAHSRVTRPAASAPTPRRRKKDAALAPDALHELARDLKTIEREKERLSRELHDGLGQDLTGIAFLAKALANRLAARSAAEAEAAQQIAALTNQAISNTRALARGLRPVGPEDNAFGVALGELTRDVASVYGIECVFSADAAIPVASRMAAHHLYRIAQEAVHNAVKHGKRDGIVVDLREDDDMIVLTIRNKGKLSAAAVDAPAGIGLTSMRHRAQLLGAVFDVRQAGNDVCVRVALDRKRAQTLREEAEES